tara:strand:- start:855 stop:1334 length:480 start_codon:yes stop_codon:yes gene_type:complete
MDTKKLIKAIQLLIKEEVKREVSKREKVLRASIIKEMKESKPMEVKDDPLEINHIFEETKQPSKPKSFTNNSMLNEMLNETANGGDWKNMNSSGGTFGASQAQAWGGGVNTQNAMFQTPDNKSVSAEQLQQTDAGQAVVSALTKDYSALMKHMNAKKGA